MTSKLNTLKELRDYYSNAGESIFALIYQNEINKLESK